MSVVMKVSKPGFDAKTAGNEDLSFSSELATHSVYNVITFRKPIGTTQVTYNHNLGYTPKTWVFVKVGTSPNDYYRRVPTLDSLYTDYYITDNTIVLLGGTADDVYFRVVVFTRDFTP